MAQIARNLTDLGDGFLHEKRFLILDRDTKFTDQFKRTLKGAGVASVLICYQDPNMNDVAERFVFSIKRECLSRLMLSGTRHLERAVRENVKHYNTERPHQGLDNDLINNRPETGTGGVVVRERLGGMLQHYHPAG